MPRKRQKGKKRVEKEILEEIDLKLFVCFSVQEALSKERD